MDQHSRAWDLIQKRQALLDQLQSQADARRAEFKQLSEEIEELSTQKDKALEGLRKQAQAELSKDSSTLIIQKRRLKFEVMRLEKQHERVTDKLEFAWSEHDDLMKVTSNLNQEVSVMMAEVKFEKKRMQTLLFDLATQVDTKTQERDKVDEQVDKSNKTLKILEGKIDSLEQRLEKRTTEFDEMEQKYSVQIAHNKQRLAMTYEQLDKALAQLKDISSKDRIMRQDLADQRLKLEKPQVRKKNNANLLEL